MSYEKVVSIIIAVYNMEMYLDKCIESIMGQSLKNFEVIMVNDGSTDKSEEMINQYVTRYPLMFRIVNKENGGLSSARNAALPLVRGKYVTFLDADDYIEETYLERLVKKAEDNNCDMVCSGQNKVSEDGIVLESIKYILKDGKCLQRRLNISGKLYKTDYINKWSLSFPIGKTYEDNSFNLQAFYLSPRIGFIEYEGYNQVVHEGSITSKPIDASRLPFEEWERVADLVKNANVLGVDIDHFDFTYISFLTYFLLIRNRKREYLSNDNKSISMDNIIIITKEFEKLINSYFCGFEKNKYLNIFSFKEIPLFQKVGARVFFEFAKRNKLYYLVRMIYRIG